MFCPSCGVTLTQQLKYCNRCGNHITSNDADLIQIVEKRMDSEMEGLFWITVFGLGLLLGGLVLMQKMHFSVGLIVAYMILSATALFSYFGLGVWQVRRLAKSWKQTRDNESLVQPDTGELGPTEARTLGEARSVTEHTTRTLEPISQSRPQDHPAM
jgi:hypothetical protein